jgi:hypothetical protein
VLLSLHRYDPPPEAVSVTLSPWQKEVGPPAITTAVGEPVFTKVIGEIAVQFEAFTTYTQYEPGVLTGMLCVVDPVFHR